MATLGKAEKQADIKALDQEQFRMEKSVLTKANFDELSMISGDRIPEALLQYICYEHQWNVFGYGVLDPSVFANSFRFSGNYLLSAHENPYQLQLRKILKNGIRKVNRLKARSSHKGQDEFICANRLENALFILANYQLNVTSTSVIDDRILVRQIGFLRVIESFAMIQDLKTGKILYTYRLNDNFRRNLSSLYLTAKRGSFISLRRSGLGVLYTFLLTLRDAVFAKGRSSTEINNTPDFEHLCSLADISQNKEPKYRKRDLNLAFDKIRKVTELEFDVEWVKGDGIERYVPLLHFIPSLDFTSESVANVRRYNERISVAVLEFKHNLAEICPYPGNRFDSEAEKYFYSWLKTDNPEEIRSIRFALEKTFVNLGCGIPGDIAQRVSYMQHLASCKDPEDIDRWLSLIFSDNSRKFQIPKFHCEESKV